MSLEFIGFGSPLIARQAAGEILSCNEHTAKYGLYLNEAQAVELAETRGHALRENGRVEFGGGLLNKIIMEFCDSPYIQQSEYSHTLCELTEIFYYYKTQTLEKIGDTELIKYMRDCFDNECRGSLDLLYGKSLDRMMRNIYNGTDAYLNEDEEELYMGEEDEYEQ
ncbi:MAG: DUF6323 family protein [Eubacteriales bacterium]